MKARQIWRGFILLAGLFWAAKPVGAEAIGSTYSFFSAGEHRLMGTDPEGEGALFEVDLTAERRLVVEVSRTSALEYLGWVGRTAGRGGGGTSLAAEPGGDGIPNIWKFGLEVGGPLEAVPGRRVAPYLVRVPSGEDRFYYGLEFTRARAPRRNRISYRLERREEDSWEPVPEAVVVAQAEIGRGLERVVLSDGRRRLPADEPPSFRLVARFDPAPTFFAHYMSGLNPGWKAMAYISTPIPAYFRLFHERADRMQPVPAGPDDHFPSTGGVHRDLPLLPPGFSFSSATDSAQLEIRRARRAGVDGFAVNCLSGETEFLEALFAGAARLHRRDSVYPPFQIGLSLDINVLPHDDRMLLPTIADLIETWLDIADSSAHAPHLARRGGMPMVMGYQSHWVWIDYLHRLWELWEFEEGWDDARLEWPAALGPAPAVTAPPEKVARDFRSAVQREAKRLAREGAGQELSSETEYFARRGFSREQAEELGREAVARRKSRQEAVRAWARDPSSWPLIREAYRAIERRVGQEVFWQFDAIDIDYISGDGEAAMRVVAAEFPAVNMFLPKSELTGIYRRVTREAGAEWGEPLYMQYVAYGQNEKEGLFRGNQHGGYGSETLLEGWRQAIGWRHPSGEAGMEPDPAGGAPPSSLIQYTTWNDYNEHTHMAPSLQLRYSLIELNRYFISLWKTGSPPPDMQNQIFLFYRKYPEEVAGETFPFAHAADLPHGKFEVVSILEEEGILQLLGQEAGAGRAPLFSRGGERRVAPGFAVESFTGPGDSELWREGAVLARVRLSSGEQLAARGWEQVTHRPFRQDGTLAGVSSRCANLWLEDAPRRELRSFEFSEYGDVDGDGLPNWFEMFYFGRGWLDLADQEIADPAGDENRDGRANLDHYRERSNPTHFSDPLPYPRDRQGRRQVLRVDARRRSTIQAEDFDLGGLGTAYHKAKIEAMGSGDYRRVRYELVPHERVPSHEGDAGSWVLKPLADGDWFIYTLEIPTGCYRVSVRVREGGGKIRMAVDGEHLLESDVGRSSWQWSTQPLGELDIPPGRPVRRLRVQFEEPGFGLNWIRFEPCRR